MTQQAQPISGPPTFDPNGELNLGGGGVVVACGLIDFANPTVVRAGSGFDTTVGVGAVVRNAAGDVTVHLPTGTLTGFPGRVKLRIFPYVECNGAAPADAYIAGGLDTAAADQIRLTSRSNAGALQDVGSVYFEVVRLGN